MNKNTTLLYLTCLLSILLGHVPSIAQNPAFEWVQQDAASSAFIRSMHMDKAGIVYTTGAFSGTVDFDPNGNSGTLTGADSTQGFLAKSNAQGELIWVKQLSSTGNCQGIAITTDSSGNVYICGTGTGTIDLDPGSGSSTIADTTETCFFAKYDADGGFIWGTKTGKAGARLLSGDIGNLFAVSPSGNVYFSGISHEDSLIFDPASGIPPIYAHYRVILPGWEVPYPIILLGKIDSAGTLDWVHGFPTDHNFNNVTNIVLDRSENVYAGGYFGAAIDFDPGPDTTLLTSYGSADAFVLKMSKDGALIWAKNMGGAGNDRGYSIAMDGCNNLYIAGDFTGYPADFDPGPNTFIITPEGSSAILPTADIFVTKLDSDGEFIWAKSMGGPGGEGVPYLTTDVYNNLYLTGKAVGNTDFNPDTTAVYNLPNHNATDWGMFVTKWNDEGQFLWAGADIMDPNGRFAHPGPNYIGVSDSGKIYVFGTFRDTVDFDPAAGIQTLIANKRNSGFVLKLDAPDFVMPAYDTTAIASCDNFTIDGQTFTTSGIYTFDLISTAGCDSVALIELTINQVIPATISIDNFTLTTASPYETYQWCLEGNLIPGADESSYMVTENGNYTVIVTDSNGCMDTSDVYTVSNYTGIRALDELAGPIRIYPNPASEQVRIESLAGHQILSVGILNMLGAEVLSASGNNRQTQTIAIGYLPAAVYLLRVHTEQGILLRKLEIVR